MAWHKKNKEWDMGSYQATKEEVEARLWCIRNKIYISPFAKDPGSWYIDITLNGKVNRSPHVYVKDMIWENIYKFYAHPNTPNLSLIHIPSPRDRQKSRMPSSA